MNDGSSAEAGEPLAGEQQRKQVPSVMGSSTKNIVIFAPPDVHALEIASVMDVFDEANRHADPDTLYSLTVVAERQETIQCASGLRIIPDQSIMDPVPEADTLLVGGSYGIPAAPSEPVITWLQKNSASARRYGAVCTGTFLLGAAGLIDRRVVTTHWYYADQLRDRFPSAKVDADRIFIRDGPLFTSAGVSACIDLALALIEEDHGRDLAVSVARHMVTYLKRPGGQSQYSVPLAAQARTQSAIARVQAWILDHPADELSLSALASQAAMSPRNFSRVFRSETGLSPKHYVRQVRMDKARRLLEETRLPLDRVAKESGFRTASSARRIFTQELGISLRQYRDRFKLGTE
jgi:transcriptional regulator GlxA family with amidase domain